jgi:hypothetical protein
MHKLGYVDSDIICGSAPGEWGLISKSVVETIAVY